MINSTSTNLFSHSISTNQNSTSAQPDKLISLTDQLVSIGNLPIEIKQMIVFKLDVQDYKNFRISSKIMMSELPSVDYMYSKVINNECFGELRRNYITVTRKLMEDPYSGIWLG